MGLTTGFEKFVRRDEPLAMHTWFHLGGPAEYFAEPNDNDELIALSRASWFPMQFLAVAAMVISCSTGSQNICCRVLAAVWRGAPDRELGDKSKCPSRTLLNFCPRPTGPDTPKTAFRPFFSIICSLFTGCIIVRCPREPMVAAASAPITIPSSHFIPTISVISQLWKTLLTLNSGYL